MTVEVEIVRWDPASPGCLMSKWRESLQRSNNFRVSLQTPEWVAFRWASLKPRLAVLRDPTNAPEPVAVTPLTYDKFAISFQLAKRRLSEIKIDGYLVNGNIPLFPSNDYYYQALVDSIFIDSKIQCVYFLGLPEGSAFHRFLDRVKERSKDLLFYDLSQSPARYFWIEMPHSYDEYCRKFNPKILYNLKRELRLLVKQANRNLDFERVTEADEVPGFLAKAQAVAEKSWQQLLIGEPLNKLVDRHGVLEGFARQRVLRCYLLEFGKQPCAYAIGFQSNEVFYFFETAYDQSYARHSPGKSLLHLILKDCFEFNTPRFFYFGPGEAPYKKLFANRTGTEINLVVLRKNWRNCGLVMAHRCFRMVVERIKATRKLMVRRLRGSELHDASAVSQNSPMCWETMDSS